MPGAYLLKGLVIGIAIAAPVGPIGILCIQRSLTDGRLIGLVSGLGAASADAIYGFIAASGLTALSTTLIEQQAWIRLFGGLFLCALGLRILRRKAGTQLSAARPAGGLGAFASTFFRKPPLRVDRLACLGGVPRFRRVVAFSQHRGGRPPEQNRSGPAHLDQPGFRVYPPGIWCLCVGYPAPVDRQIHGTSAALGGWEECLFRKAHLCLGARNLGF